MNQYLHLPDVILTKKSYEWTNLENPFRKYCFRDQKFLSTQRNCLNVIWITGLTK